MTMEQMLTLIGQGAESEAVRGLISSDSLIASSDPDLEEGEPTRHSLSSPHGGYELTSVQGRITAVHLFLEATNEYQPFVGSLVSGLTAGSSREEVRHRLGRPSRSGEAKTIPILGRQGSWDRYDGEKVCIHFQYAESEGRIRVVTLMVADLAPERQV